MARVLVACWWAWCSGWSSFTMADRRFDPGEFAVRVRTSNCARSSADAPGTPDHVGGGGRVIVISLIPRAAFDWLISWASNGIVRVRRLMETR